MDNVRGFRNKEPWVIINYVITSNYKMPKLLSNETTQGFTIHKSKFVSVI